MRHFAGLAAGLALLCAGSASADTSKPVTSLPQLDRALAQAFRDAKVPGGQVAIVEHGQVVFTRSYGLADRAKKIPVTDDTVFRAGSISKSFTSIAIMTAVEQRKLSLDGTLSQLAPDVHFVNPWEKTDPVRLVNLLEHTTGWPDISTRVLAQDGKGWSVLKGVQFTSPEFTSRWAPGRYAVYNNAGPAVAGAILEKATGESFENYMNAHVLRPMGMATADFDPPPALAQRIAKSYAPDGSVVPYQYIILPPAGSLNTNARELAQLVRFFLGRGTVDGKQILTPQSVDRIERSESNIATRYGFTMGYGLGNAVFPESGINFRGHNGQIDAFTAVYGYLMRCDCGYVLMANGGDGVDFATPISGLVEHYLTRGLKMAPPPTVAVPDSELARYAGVYRNISPPNRLAEPFTDILNMSRVSAGHGKLTESGNDFFPTAEHIFRRADREQPTLAFLEDGGQTYKVSAFYTAVKMPWWQVIVVVLIEASIALGAVFAVAMMPFWLTAGFRGRLAARGGWAVRFVPSFSAAALIVTFGLALYGIVGAGTSALTRLSGVGPYSLAIFAGSILFPVLALWGLWLAARTQNAPLVIRIYAGLTCLALLAFSAYAASIGWIGARTWTM